MTDHTCEICNHTYVNKQSLKNHLITLKHIRNKQIYQHDKLKWIADYTYGICDSVYENENQLEKDSTTMQNFIDKTLIKNEPERKWTHNFINDSLIQNESRYKIKIKPAFNYGIQL